MQYCINHVEQCNDWTFWVIFLSFGLVSTDGPTDRRTDKASYRDAWTHLKTNRNGFRFIVDRSYHGWNLSSFLCEVFTKREPRIVLVPTMFSWFHLRIQWTPNQDRKPRGYHISEIVRGRDRRNRTMSRLFPNCCTSPEIGHGKMALNCWIYQTTSLYLTKR